MFYLDFEALYLGRLLSSIYAAYLGNLPSPDRRTWHPNNPLLLILNRD